MRLRRLFLGTVAVGAALSAAPARAQYGNLSAVNQFQRLSNAFKNANAVEYTSVVSALNEAGRPVQFFVHVKMQRPGRFWMSASHTAPDAPDAALVVANPNIIYEYDPQQHRVAQGTPTDEGLRLPDGFTGLEPALLTPRQFFALQPFLALLPSDPLSPLQMIRRGLDLPNTLLLTVQTLGGQNKAGPVGLEQWTRVWIDLDTAAPRRIVLADRRNGTESERFHEEFTRFTFNPDIPTSVFLWTPPEDPTPATSQALSGGSKVVKHAPAKRKPAKARRPHARAKG
jgi:outer membrane lipoprotein-sorting protein